MKQLTPLRAIRRKCLECCNNQFVEVKLCPVETCPLYPLRFGKGIRGKGISPLKAIRKRCLDCGEGTAFDVRNCIIDDCPIYPYRFGKRPSTVLKRQNMPEHPSGKRFFEESPKEVSGLSPKKVCPSTPIAITQETKNRGNPNEALNVI